VDFIFYRIGEKNLKKVLHFIFGYDLMDKLYSIYTLINRFYEMFFKNSKANF